eukprot:89040-Prymnesium_polylepis.3
MALATCSKCSIVQKVCPKSTGAKKVKASPPSVPQSRKVSFTVSHDRTNFVRSIPTINLPQIGLGPRSGRELNGSDKGERESSAKGIRIGSFSTTST